MAALRRQPDDRVGPRARERERLRIYNWNGYLWPRIKKDFAKEYGVKVEETYFSTTRRGGREDLVGRGRLRRLLPDARPPRPPRRRQVAPAPQPRLPPEPRRTSGRRSRIPGTTRSSQYTVPYTTWTTGIGYRTDKVATTPDSFSNPYEIYWDEAEPREDVPPRRQPRRACAHAPEERDHGHQHRGPRRHRRSRRTSSSRSIDAVNIKLSTDDYTNLPEGRAWVHQMWSGSAISAQWYLPEGTGPEALGFWFPRGRQGHDRERHASPSRATRRTRCSRTTS